MKLLTLLLLVAPLAGAQDSWAGAGASYSQAARPQVAGWIAYAKLLGAGFYSVSSYEVTTAKAHTFQAQPAVTTGIGTIVRTAGLVTFLAYADAGVAASGDNVGGAFGPGGYAVIRLGKSHFTLLVGGRMLKTSIGGSQTMFQLGLGVY